ncbi:MAG: hypothetical protein ABIQ58_01570 [Candidatus Limnocylindrales bacterium]
MGPDDPWSANWRPDDSGERLRTIRAARRGSILAVLVYVPVALVAAAVAPATFEVAFIAATIGLPGVALLGAGLTPSTLGSRVWAVVSGLAFAVGAPVAAVTSLVIGGYVADSFIGDSTRFAGPFLRAAVTAATSVVPLVALASALWVLAVRRLNQRSAGSPRRPT